jgi:hypothetical protein
MVSTLSKLYGREQSVACANGNVAIAATFKATGDDQKILPTTRPLRVWGTAQRALDLGLLVLRLESYLTESVELAYTLDDGPRTEGLRQSVSPSRHQQANAFPMQTTRRAGLCHTTSLPPSSFSGKAESLYARLGCLIDRSRSSARLHAVPGIWIRRLKDDESDRLFRYALAEPFCATECIAAQYFEYVGWVGRQAKQVNTYPSRSSTA